MPEYVPVSPVLDDDPPKVGDFWLDARLGATPSGVAFTGHDERGRTAMVILLSQGAAADAAARDRLAGVVNRLHIDTVLARGGHGQDFGRLGRKYQAEEDDPVAPDDRMLAPWVALAYDGSPGRGGRIEADPRRGSARRLYPPRARRRDRTTPTTGSTRCGLDWLACGRCPGRVDTTGRGGARSWCPGC